MKLGVWSRLVALLGSLPLAGILVASCVPAAAAQRASSPGGKFVYVRDESHLAPAGMLLEIDEEVVQSVVDTMNHEIRIPEDVTVTGDTCSTVNAYYRVHGGVRVITLCYGLLDEIGRWVLGDLGTQDLSLDYPARTLALMIGRTNDVLRFTLLHEIGHAVIDLFKLPVLGRSEDAADEFAVWVMMTHGNWWPTEVQSWFSRLAQRTASGDIVVTPDEAGGSHATAAQRGYLVQCLTDGWFDSKDKGFLGEQPDSAPASLVPGRTLGECRAEWRTVSSSWSALLRTHLRR